MRTDQRRLEGKIALVTGGAGGIGSAICQVLAAAGARVIITYHNNAARAEALRKRLPGDGHLVTQLSVRNTDQVSALASHVAQRYGGIHILVNNAGTTRVVPHSMLDELDDSLINEIFETNWRGAFAMVRAFRGLLCREPVGVVINISSIAGTTAVGSNIAYCASKAALDNLTKSLARALAPDIRVVSVAPGWVMGEYALTADPAYIARQRELTPLGRLAEADDVASAVYAAIVHLGFTNGAIIPVDGGRPLN